MSREIARNVDTNTHIISTAKNLDPPPSPRISHTYTMIPCSRAHDPRPGPKVRTKLSQQNICAPAHTRRFHTCTHRSLAAECTIKHLSHKYTYHHHSHKSMPLLPHPQIPHTHTLIPCCRDHDPTLVHAQRVYAVCVCFDSLYHGTPFCIPQACACICVQHCQMP